MVHCDSPPPASFGSRALLTFHYGQVIATWKLFSRALRIMARSLSLQFVCYFRTESSQSHPEDSSDNGKIKICLFLSRVVQYCRVFSFFNFVTTILVLSICLT